MAVVEEPVAAMTRTQTRDGSAVHIAGLAITVLFGASAVVNLGAFVMDASPFPRTHLAAAALALYLMAEAKLYIRRSDAFGLLSPAFLALPLHFFLSYLVGITYAAFDFGILDSYAVRLSDLDAALAGTMLMAILSTFCMLRGYGLARPMARRVRRAIERMQVIRREVRPALGLAVVMQFAYFALVSYAIYLGTYGLLSTSETVLRNQDFQQYLNLALSAGTLSYFLILLRYFERREAGKAGPVAAVLVGIMIALHVFSGALSAFKSQMVFPFVLAGFAYFMATRRMPVRFMAYAFVALIAAYAVIEPFRSHISLRGKPPQNTAEAVDAIITSLGLHDELSRTGETSYVLAIAGRLDLVGMTAVAIEYVDADTLQIGDRQAFQNSIFLAPILAFVPRVMWPDKPIYEPGVWFNQTVLGQWHDSVTSVGMGPIGYLYMSGGILAVMLGFIGFGVLQALIFEGFGRAGAGGLIIFLSVAGSLVMIPSSFGPTVTGVLRTLPVAFVAQMILLRSGQAPRK